MGPDYARGRGNIFLVISLVILAVGIGVTAGTYTMATTHSGIYAVYVGAFVLALIIFARSIYYYFMKISIIEGPM